MSRSIQIHPNHIEKIKEAVKAAGFKKQQALADEVGVTRQTVNKFLNGKPIDVSNFDDICKCLDIKPEIVSDLSITSQFEEITYEGQLQFRDWGDAPEVDFSGHVEGKKRLKQWIEDKNCRVIIITGLARIGKTFLASEVARMVANQFEFLIWRSVRHDPKPNQLFKELLNPLVKDELSIDESDSSELIRKLLAQLAQHRCLIILNQMESVMQTGEGIGNFKDEYKDYSELLRNIGDKSHRSTFLLIGQEPMKDFIPYAGDNRPIRHLEITGLHHEEARKILEEKNIHGSPKKISTLIRRYGGHPMFLRIAATHIKQLKEGDINQFLAKDDAPIIFNGIEVQLDSITARLSNSERTVINWLAICFKPLTEPYLRGLVRVSPEHLRHILVSLRRRCLIKITGNGCYEIDDYLREYLIYKMKQTMVEEIKENQLKTFSDYPLIIAQLEDTVMEKQEDYLVFPILKDLLITHGNPHYLKRSTNKLLKEICTQFRHRSSYAAANLLTLLKYIELKYSLSQNLVLNHYDFSDLMVKQADLRRVSLQDIDFSHTDLSQSTFYETFAGILSVAVSQDGQFLAAGDASHHVYVWKLDEQRFTFHRRYQGHTHWVRTVVISPSGRYLASGSEDHTVRIWNLENGESVSILRGYDSRIRSLVFTPEEDYLASASDDNTVVLWSTKTWQRVTYTGSLEDRQFREIVFEPINRILIAAHQSGVIHYWDIEKDKELQHPHFLNCGDKKNLVRTAAIHPEGHILATGNDDGIVKLWRFPTGELLQKLPGQVNWIRKVIFNQDGSLIASSSENGRIQVWDTNNGQLKCVIDAHSSRTWEIAFGSDGKTLISGSDDRYIKLWDLETGECLRHLQGYTCKIRAVAFSPDSCWLASGGDDQIIRIWDVASGICINEFAGHTGRVWAVAFYHSTRSELCLISGSDDRTVKIWNVGQGNCIKTVKTHTSWVRAVSNAPGYPWVLSGGDDKVIRAFNTDTFQTREFSANHTDWILSVAMTANGCLAVSGSDDRTVKIWNVETGKFIATIASHDSGIRAVAIDPDDYWCATGGKDGVVRLFDLKDVKYTEHPHSPLRGHNGWVRCIAFHPKQPFLASGGYDQKVIVWNLETGEARHMLRGHNEAIISVAFSPDGQTLATGSEDETIKLWETETGKLIRTISMPKPYQGLNITGAMNISREQRMKLIELGAIEEENQCGW
ncbi:MAG: NB-ARC domain-containing protein [Cyanobacteria bacterium P01_G01_bin.54]